MYFTLPDTFGEGDVLFILESIIHITYRYVKGNPYVRLKLLQEE